jgi:hypothetical protein
MKKIPALKHFRTIALIVVLAGAAGSLGLVLHTGRNNNSVLLLSLFVAWVLSPFIVLLVINAIAKRWPAFTRATHYCLMLVVAFGSLISYSGVLSPPGTKPAFVFLVVPLVSWLLMVIVIPMAALLSRRLSRRSTILSRQAE